MSDYSPFKPPQSITRQYSTSADCHITPLDITAAPAAGHKIVAVDVLVSVKVACQVSVITETVADVVASGYLPAYAGFQPLALIAGVKGTTAAKKLQVMTDVAAAITVVCNYYTEP